MRHVRDATRSYARRTTIHGTTASADTATLALRLNQLTTPTLLSPSQTRRHTDYEDNDELSRSTPEFQPNGFFKSPSRYFLAGLGIHYGLDSSDILQISDETYSSGACDGQDVMGASRRSTPAGTVFQLRDHTAKKFPCMTDSRSSLRFISDTSLPDLAYPSSSSSASLASTRSASDNDSEGAQAPTASFLPFHLEDDVLPYSPVNIGLIPDVNMYNLALLTKQPSVGVDPLDTMGRVSRSFRTALSPSQVLPSPCNAASCGSPPYNLGPNLFTVGELTPPPPSHDFPSSGIIHDIATVLSTIAPEGPGGIFLTNVHSKQPSLEEAAGASPIIKIESNEPALYVSSPNQEECYVPLKHDTFSFPSDGAFPSREIKIEHNHFTQDEPYPSPILNAHVGIELAELAFRAQRYRARHPGQGIDRTWLMRFAGKLTNRGELIEDYRCYVVGCSQRNKRRDHIVIHVGAHVDQRAFSCSIWFVLFLLHLQRSQANTDGWMPIVHSGSSVRMNANVMRQPILD